MVIMAAVGAVVVLCVVAVSEMSVMISGWHRAISNANRGQGVVVGDRALDPVRLVRTAGLRRSVVVRPWQRVVVEYDRSLGWTVSCLDMTGAVVLLEPQFRPKHDLTGLQVFADCVIGEVTRQSDGQRYWFVVRQAASGAHETRRFGTFDEFVAALE